MAGSVELSREAVAAMLAVMNGSPAADVWLAYVRAVHPEAVDALARMAVSQIAVDLLQSRGDLDREQARDQRHQVALTARGEVSTEVWAEISELRTTLAILERHLGDASSEVLVEVDDVDEVEVRAARR